MKGKGHPMPKRGESQEKFYARMMGSTPEKLMAGMDRQVDAKKKPARKRRVKRGGK